MSLIIGSARIDENGHISGGKPGDQTGNEVSTQAYYVHSKGWYCLRPKKIAVANAIAEAMLQGCRNVNIGYCQGHRSNVIEQLRKAGRLAKISTKTEADCSSLVRACCIQAGFDPGNFNTANAVPTLKATDEFMDPIAVTSKTELFNGDVLVTKTKGHIVVVVSGNPRQAASQNSSSAASSSKVDDALHRDKSLSGKYTVTTGLNLRTGAGTEKKILTTMPKGSSVNCYGYYNTDKNGKKWLYITYNNGKKQFTGYASSAYLKR